MRTVKIITEVEIPDDMAADTIRLLVRDSVLAALIDHQIYEAKFEIWHDRSALVEYIEKATGVPYTGKRK